MEPWPEHVTEILGADLVVALGYRTPAGGVVVTPVTTLGMFDQDAGTITTTTTFGNGRKLVRIERDDRVALLFHTRQHGTSRAPHVVLAQGRASFPERADDAWVTPEVAAAWDRMLVARKRGRFWDWVGREYYDLRVPVTVQLHRLTVWPESDGTGQPRVLGVPAPSEPPPDQPPPQGGTGPRVPAKRYAKRLGRGLNRVVGWVDADGFPMLVPAGLTLDGERVHVQAPGLPDGSRRAGLLAHWFEPRLKGQSSALLTGWLEASGGVGLHHPHTSSGYAMPKVNDAAFSLGAGLAAKDGYRRLARAGHVRDGVWQRQA